MVALDPASEKIKRIIITGRERDFRMIDSLANSAGLTRSAYMVQARMAPSTKGGKPGGLVNSKER